MSFSIIESAAPRVPPSSQERTNTICTRRPNGCRAYQVQRNRSGEGSRVGAPVRPMECGTETEFLEAEHVAAKHLNFLTTLYAPFRSVRRQRRATRRACVHQAQLGQSNGAAVRGRCRSYGLGSTVARFFCCFFVTLSYLCLPRASNKISTLFRRTCLFPTETERKFYRDP